MSQKSSHNSKRRPPGDKPTGDPQDADWGFDDDVDPAVEKKLGLVLVVCLLAGFGFVFFQKFRLLQHHDAPVAGNDTKAVAAEKPDDTPSPADAADSRLTSLGDATPVNATEDSADPSAVESPFYSPDDAATSAPVAEESWTLSQAEVPQPSSLLSASSSSSPTSVESTPGELPPLPQGTSSDTFDPFAQTEEPDAASPGPTSAEPTASESLPLTWVEPPLPPSQSEPEAMQIHSSPSSIEEPASEQVPFPFEEPDTPPSPAPPADDEPAMLIFGAPEEPPASTDEDPSTIVIEPFPQQAEPQPAESAPAIMSESDPVQTKESATAGNAFDPFSQAEVPQPETETASIPTEGDFTFPAPPVAEESPSQPDAEELTTPNVVEPPAWPFGDTADASEPSLPSTPSSPAAEPATMTIQPNAIEPSPSAAIGQSTSTGIGSSNPFSFDNHTSPSVVTSSLAAQPVIGEREIVVTPSDSFWSISEREYGSPRYVTALAKHNRDRVSRPEQLQPGMKITIPPPEVLESRFPELFRRTGPQRGSLSPMSGSSTSQAPAGLFLDEQHQPRYRVGQQDTLSSIAQQHLGRSSRWTEVYDLNRDQLTSPSTLTIGMVLKLPLDAGGANVFPAGGFDR